jgi:multiple antibiotic resistance protein
MKKITGFLRRSPIPDRLFGPALVCCALVLSLVFYLPTISTSILAATAQPPAAPEIPKDIGKFNSTFEAQASLIPKIRKFYGGDKGYRGSVAIFFLTIGPLKIIPAFLKLTAKADNKLRFQLALRGFIISTVAVLFAALMGQNLLDKYNIPLTAIVAAAGIVLFLVALRIVLSQYGDDDPSDPPPENPSLDLVIQPLVFPTILTPYGIAVVITASALARAVDGDLIRLMLTLLAIMVLNFLAMLFAKQILYVLKPRILQVIGLVLGVIQLSLGLGLIFSALELQALVIKELLTM